jgi:hypothetical protein
VYTNTRKPIVYCFFTSCGTNVFRMASSNSSLIACAYIYSKQGFSRGLWTVRFLRMFFSVDVVWYYPSIYTQVFRFSNQILVCTSHIPQSCLTLRPFTFLDINILKKFGESTHCGASQHIGPAFSHSIRFRPRYYSKHLVLKHTHSQSVFYRSLDRSQFNTHTKQQVKLWFSIF